MSRLFTLTLAATAALGFAAPTLAQAPATTDAMPSADLPWCSTAVTDHCRQHEGRSGMMMMHHHSMMHRHHHKHHRMMKHHGSMKKM